jgi:hypothetical protein
MSIVASAGFGMLGGLMTQDAICVLSAMIACKQNGAPKTDVEFIEAGAALARGLFGDAYQTRCDQQRAIWNDMCERAFRIAVEAEA